MLNLISSARDRDAGNRGKDQARGVSISGIETALAAGYRTK